MAPSAVAQVVPHATSFIRGPALELARLVPRLDLYVRHNPVAELARWLPGPAAARLRRHAWAEKGAGLEWPGNVRVARCPMAYLRRDGANPGLGRRLGRRLGRLLERDGPHRLLHAHFLHPEGVAAAAAARRLSLPLVVTGHGFDVHDLPDRGGAWRTLVDETLEAADAVTAVSLRLAARLRQLGVPEGKLHVVHNGFDPARFHPRPKAECRRALGLPERGTVVLTVGNLVPVKGHDRLLAGMADLLRRTPGLLLAVVGDGPLAGPLAQQARDLGIASKVRFAGHRPHGEVPAWMNAADLFVLPSREEGAGVVVLEALACGTPVAATAVGHAPEVLSRRNGLLAADGSPDAIGAAVAQALATKYDARAVAASVKAWTWESAAQRTAAVYDRVAPPS